MVINILPPIKTLNEKLLFYFNNKTIIEFRLKDRPEYFYKGIIEWISGNKKIPMQEINIDGILLDLLNGSKMLFSFDDISESSIHPASINPIQYFDRKNISDENKTIVKQRCKGLCELRLVGCSHVFEEVDHWIPCSRGGSNDISNLRGSCAHCNRKKSDRLWEEIPLEDKQYG